MFSIIGILMLFTLQVTITFTSAKKIGYALTGQNHTGDEAEFGIAYSLGLNTLGFEDVRFENQTISKEDFMKNGRELVSKRTNNFDRLPITFHGGDVRTHPLRTHVVYVGNDFDGDTIEIVDRFMNDVGDIEDPLDNWYWPIVMQYTDPNDANTRVSTIDNRESLWIDSDLPASMTGQAIKDTLKFAIGHGYGTGDNNDFYLIVLDGTIGYPGQCESSCSIRQKVTIKISGKKKTIYYAVIGNPYYCVNAFPDKLFSTCSRLDGYGCNAPNGNVEADTMVDMMGVQTAAFATNPNGNGWHDSDGVDLADKCSDYGTSVFWDGGVASEHINGYSYYLRSLYNVAVSGDYECDVSGCTQGWEYAICTGY